MSEVHTRQDALLYIEQSFAKLSEQEKDAIITSDGIRDLTHRDIYDMVHDPSNQAGIQYLDSLIAILNHH